MNDKCIFCEIIKGNIPSTKLYEDDSVLAIADAFPCRDGHFIVIPKKHIENIFQIDEITLSKIFTVVQKICKSYKKYNSEVGLNIVQNNGEVAGQTVNHFHVHIIPVVQDESLAVSWNTKDFNLNITNDIIKNVKENM